MTPTDLSEIIQAVERHRLRMADLVDGLDDACRSGRTDLDGVVAYLSDDLRTSNRRLQTLVAELSAPVPEKEIQPWP